MTEKKIYEAPELKIIELKSADVITTSGIPHRDDGYSQYYPDPILKMTAMNR